MKRVLFRAEVKEEFARWFNYELYRAAMNPEGKVTQGDARDRVRNMQPQTWVYRHPDWTVSIQDYEVTVEADDSLEVVEIRPGLKIHMDSGVLHMDNLAATPSVPAPPRRRR